MVIGIYLTSIRKMQGKAGLRFTNEVIMAYGSGVIDLHAPVKMRVEKEIDGKKKQDH